jgi:hypothetical protein
MLSTAIAVESPLSLLLLNKNDVIIIYENTTAHFFVTKFAVVFLDSDPIKMSVTDASRISNLCILIISKEMPAGMEVMRSTDALFLSSPVIV